MKLRPNALRFSIAFTSALGLASAAQAATVDYGVDVGIGETDNINLTPTDKVSQTMAITDIDFAIKQQSRRLDLDAKGDFSYLDYLQGAYASQLVGRFDGLAQLALIPERLTWTFQDSFGQTQIDPFAAVTPANQEHVNYASTGPNLFLRFGPLAFVDVTARYARTDYQTSPFDSNRFSGSLAIGHQLSASSSVSVNVSSERVLFDDTVLNTDFNRSSVYAHYELRGARTTLSANLGATKVDQGGESVTGALGKLELSRQLSSAAKLTFTVGRDLTDGSTSFNGTGDVGGAGGVGITPGGALGGNNTAPGGASSGIATTPAAVTSANYTVTYASAGWNYVRNRTTFGLTGRWEKDTYDGLPQLNVTRGDAGFSIERKLNRAFSAQLLGSIYRTEYANADFAETDGRVGAALTFRQGRGLEVRLRYDHTSRIASGISSGSGYSENRAFLTIGYRPEPKGRTTT